MMDGAGASPIPPLVFTVAITGHQDIPAAQHAALQASIGALLDAAAVRLLAARAENRVDRDRAVSLRFLSALAPGADQIAAQAALGRVSGGVAWQLNVILPFEMALYQQFARTALNEKNAARSQQARAALSTVEIEAAVAGIADLAHRADRSLELADWRPASDCGFADCEAHEDHWRSRRYATLGQMLVRQADLLIALWDGNPPSGKGGTADVVSEARRNGVPVLWIEREPPHALHSLVPDAGSRHLPASDVVARLRGDDQRVMPLVIRGETAAIAAAVRNVLLGVDGRRARPVEGYAEREKARLWQASDWRLRPKGHARYGTRAMLYQLMLYLVLRVPTSFRHAEAEGQPILLRSWPFEWARSGHRVPRPLIGMFQFESGVKSNPGDVMEQATRVEAPIMPFAERADAIATRLGHHYRSAYVAIFALASIAVAFAVAYLPFGEGNKKLFVGVELLCVLSMAVIFHRHSANDPHRKKHRLLDWAVDTHQRWLDARLIAESQRGAQLLSWVGFAGRRPVDDPDPAARPDHARENHGHDRAVWAPYFANAISALPDLPEGTTPGDPARMDPDRIACLAEAAGQVIASQAGYHEGNEQRLAKLHHRLDKIGLAALALAFFVSAAYLLLAYLHGMVPALEHAYHILKPWAAFAGSVGPAIAAATAGIRFQGDYERFALRSKDTARRLRELGERAEALRVRASKCHGKPCSAQPPLFEPLLGLLLDTQAVMDEDLADWRFAYAARPMTLG